MKMVVAVCFIALVVGGSLSIIERLRTQAEVEAQISDLAHRADTQSTPPVYSADRGAGSYCIDVVYRLKGQGYKLETPQKLLTTVVDMGLACSANEQITIRPK